MIDRRTEARRAAATHTGEVAPEGASEAFDVDFGNFDRESIPLLAIQPFGFLVAVSKDLVFEQVSANSADWLGEPPERLVGRWITDVIGDELVHALRNRLQYLRGSDQVERLFGLRAIEAGPPLDLAIHLSGRSIVIEGERSQAAETAPSSATLRTMIGRLRSARRLPDLLNDAARLFQALTGYDRVIVYRFAGDGSGEVVAESRRGKIDSFFGQCFPVADIPQQARRLSLRNWVRIVADTAAEPVAVRPPPHKPSEEPLDLSMSVLRSASPAHLEQLSNIGVRGSLSASVIVGGRLWGLLACHHSEPLVVPLETRTSAELFAQILSLLIEVREREEEAAYDERAQSLHRRLMASLATEATVAQNLAAHFQEMSEALDCHGVGIWADGKATLSGTTPSAEQFAELAAFLRREAGNELYAETCLASVDPAAKALLPGVAGLLAVPISRTPRDYLVFFRKELASTMSSAGEPVQVPSGGRAGPDAPGLAPRKSLEARQKVEPGRCAAWSAAERRFAEALRATIIEVVLRLTEVATGERERAREKQELLVAELNHRVRNILALMRAIISQSRYGAQSVEQFAGVLGERIQALARAHDQITRDHWGPAPLRGLLEAETAASLPDMAGRVRHEGPDVLLRPQAFSTLALVFHELVTNAAEHGALSDGTGSVAIDWRRDGRGDLIVEWRETGGPPVRAPLRRGFGSTIIERSVPYDLHGEATVEFALEGLRARFLVPAYHTVAEQAGAEAGRRPAGTAAVASGPGSGGRALVVEDNLIVAMEAEDILRELGFEAVETTASVASALHEIEERRPDFAVLDVNLGRESSFPVADRLAELQIPFLFATGYGEGAALPAAHGDRPCLSKPFNSESFRRVLAASPSSIGTG